MSKISLHGNAAGTATFSLQAPATSVNRNIFLPDQDGTLSTSDKTMLPVGALIWMTGTTVPTSFVAAQGQLLQRATYPDLWAYAQASGNIAASDVSWVEGQYSPGDGSTNFRVPKFDDRFVRGKSATRAVGLVEEDEFKSHTHSYAGATGAPTTGSNMMTASYGTPGAWVSNATGGDETRPKALTMLACIKAYDFIDDPEVITAANVLTDIINLETNKLDKSDNIVLGASVTASGTAVDFEDIPAGVKRVTVMFDGVSTNGTSIMLLRLGAGSVEVSGYAGVGGYLSVGNGAGAMIMTNGFGFNTSNLAVVIHSGSITLDSFGGNTWVASGVVGREDSGTIHFCGGKKSLSAPLDRIRITTVNGTDTFDAGTISISWEF
jgi:hypothetical protein